MSILVTGGAGFIGSHLIERLLHAGDEPLVCLDNFNSYYDPRLKRLNVQPFAADPQVTVVEADFCDAVAMHQLFAEQEVHQVVHLGAYAGVRASVKFPELYVRNNVSGTLALLEAARRGKVERFVLASSSTVYGAGVEIPFGEDRSLGVPTSPYGATKRSAELLGLTYWQLHQLPVVCVRPFSVYGPRLRPDLALTIFTDAIEQGRPLPLFGDGSVRRDFTHVRDICSGLIAALHAPEAVGQEINLGHNEPVAMIEVIRQLEDALGKRAEIDYRPPRSEDLPATWADLSKARRLLGYETTVPFSDGVAEFVAWFRESRRQLSQSPVRRAA